MSRKLEALAHDLRYALRVLSRSPGFTAVAALSLALGIGANTAIFSLIDAVLLKRLPVRNPSELVAMGDQQYVNGLSNGNERTDLFSVPFFRDIEKQNDVFAGMYASGRTGQVIEGAADSGVHPSTRIVSGGFFDVLGVRPLLGHTFTPAETAVPGRSPVVVIGADYWKRRFNGSAGALGSRLVLNGYPFTVIGVAPREFFGDVVGAKTDIWVPLAMQEQLLPGRSYLNDRHTCWLLLMGRLKPGISFEQARARLTALTRQIVIQHEGPGADPGNVRDLRQAQVPIVPGVTGFSRLRQQFSGSLLTLMALVGVVLLIACANLANLLLARATTRRREIAVRLAIGAERGRILWQLVSESLLLAMFGGALGVLVAFWASQGLLFLASTGDKAIPLDVAPDRAVFLFTFGVALITGVLFGLAPAVRATRVEVAPTLRETSRSLAGAAGRISAGRVLVVAQVALSVLLVFGAGLFVRTLLNLETVDMGFPRDRILMLDVDPIASGYKQDRLMPLSLEVMDRLRQIPGVQAASFSENGVFSGTNGAETVDIPGYKAKSEQDLTIAMDRVGPDYFQTLGASILLGRGIERRDGPGAHQVAVINESMAKSYFPGQNPIGRQLRMENGKTAIEIVGVAHDLRDHSLRDQVPPRFYLSALQNTKDFATFNFEIRTGREPSALVNAVRASVRGLDPGLRISRVAPVNEQIGETLGEDRLVARLSAVFGGMALALAAFGLYGVLSYNVARRSGEIGVRVALGASSSGVLWMVLREALGLVLLGLAIGVPAAAAGGRLVASRLFGLAPWDPLTLLVASAVMIAVAVLAAWLPAWRAAKVDPMLALRYE